MWWFYGFKLHLIINDKSGIILVKVMIVNMDDRKLVLEMADELWRCLYGDKGYISGPLERELEDKGVTLITGVKKYGTKCDETLELTDAPQTIYY
ncbi:Mobile element protein [Candidatus Enterovibrio escicola]|uniref:Mobile element protein n=1 Tax=Candidatus Enterovibrio escicola TaxID=1927127 RepID=A0A2A5T044_9GAMM|nr:Mobile element protein [Candidatus Enterovibrio escacola]